MVWGILYYQRGARTLDELPGAIEEGVHGAPDCPILSIEGVGSILVARGDAVVGRVTRGEFARAVPTPFYPHAMGLTLHELFGLRMTLKANRYVDDGDNAYGSGLLECLKYLLERLDRAGAGALVVLGALKPRCRTRCSTRSWRGPPPAASSCAASSAHASGTKRR